MKHLLLVAALSMSALSAQAQYSRSLFYGFGGSKLRQTTALPAETTAGEIRVFKYDGADGTNLKLSSVLLDPMGDMVSEAHFSVPYTTPLQGYDLSGSFAEGNGVYTLVLLNEISTTQQMIAYVQVNVNTNAVLNTYFPSQVFKVGFVNTVRNGSELATYLIGSAGGVQRIAKALSSFSTITVESVDTSQNPPTMLVISGRKNEVVVFNGQEYLLLSKSSDPILYKRNGANSYTSTGFASTSGNYIDLTTNGSQLVALCRDHYFVIDNNLTVVSDGLLTNLVPFSSTSTDFFFHNNHYYYIRALNNSSMIVEYDASFTETNTIPVSYRLNIHEATVAGNNVYLNGSLSNQSFTQRLGADGNELSEELHAYVAFAPAFPAIMPFYEYQQPFAQNELNVTAGQNGSFMTRTPNGLAGTRLAVNEEETAALVFQGQTLFAGKDVNGNLHGTARSAFESDLLTGPYTASASYDQLLEAKYNRGFYVTREMIETHIDNLQAGTPNYVAPHGIREWPAHGDVAKGQAADLAAFVDVDNDGQYEPYAGDYPSIYGDRCFLALAYNTNSGTEVQSYTYTFDCADSAYRNTVFMKQLFVQRGTVALSDFYAGTFMDTDLGGFQDDYVGTHVGLGMIYNYNGDLLDEPMNGQPGFGTKLPAQGLLYLKGAPQEADETDNAVGVGENESVNGLGFGDGIVDNEYYTLEASVAFSGTGAAAAYSDPMNIDQLYNILHGYYRFGDPQFYGVPAGGSGSLLAHFAWPGASDSVGYGTGGTEPGFDSWEFDNAEMPTPPGDRRMIGSTRMVDLHPGDSLELELAYICARDTAMQINTITDPLNLLFEYAATIKADFIANQGPCGNFEPIEEDLSVNELENDPFFLFPNPTKDVFAVAGMEEGTYTATIYDLNGRLLATHELSKALNTISVAQYDGSLFLVHISNGKQTAVKRLAKQ